jgi:hypothetical protein
MRRGRRLTVSSMNKTLNRLLYTLRYTSPHQNIVSTQGTDMMLARLFATA